MAPGKWTEERIKKGVERTYDEIAPYFAGRRERLWPPMISFIDEVSPCTLGDLGCGTGRALTAAADAGCRVIGIDSSEGQLEMSKRSLEEVGHLDKARLIRGDMEDLPLPDDSLDACMMIAVIHHLPTKNRRVKALREALRATKENGRAQISVWSWNQDRFRDRHISRMEGAREPDDLDGPLPGDQLVAWKDGRNVLRFYHLYGPGELRAEMKESGWFIQREYFDGRNHWAECIKDA